MFVQPVCTACLLPLCACSHVDGNDTPLVAYNLLSKRKASRLSPFPESANIFVWLLDEYKTLLGASLSSLCRYAAIWCPSLFCWLRSPSLSYYQIQTSICLCLCTHLASLCWDDLLFTQSPLHWSKGCSCSSMSVSLSPSLTLLSMQRTGHMWPRKSFSCGCIEYIIVQSVQCYVGGARVNAYVHNIYRIAGNFRGY